VNTHVISFLPPRPQSADDYTVMVNAHERNGQWETR